MRSFWSDEFWSIQTSSLPFLEGLKATIHDVHGPLYYSYLNLWEKAFGHSEISMFLSMAPIAILFWAFTRNWFVALSPCLLHGVYELRGYGLFAVLVVLALWAYAKKREYVFIFAVICALYTEHMAWIWALCLLSLDRKNTITAMCLGIPMLMLAFGQAVFSEKVFDAQRLVENYQPIWMLKKIIGFYFHSIFGFIISMIDPAKLKWF